MKEKKNYEQSKKYKTAVEEGKVKDDEHQKAGDAVLQSQTEVLLIQSAANAAVKHHFLEDVPIMLSCMDLGFHQVNAQHDLYPIFHQSLLRLSKARIMSIQHLVQDENKQMMQIQHNSGRLDSRFDV